MSDDDILSKDHTDNDTNSMGMGRVTVEEKVREKGRLQKRLRWLG